MTIVDTITTEKKKVYKKTVGQAPTYLLAIQWKSGYFGKRLNKFRDDIELNWRHIVSSVWKFKNKKFKYPKTLFFGTG